MISRWFVSRTCAAVALVVVVSAVGGHLFFPLQTRRTVGQSEEIVSFYASFDQNALADQAVGSETPLANQNLKIVPEGRRGGALYLDFGSLLTYDAPGNLYAERGTVAFWWKLDEPVRETPFSLFRISTTQHLAENFTFAELIWTGTSLRLSFFDRYAQPHTVEADSRHELVSGRWFHLAFTWDELDGIRLYIDGHPVGQQRGELHLAGDLDQIGIHASLVTPHQARGTERKVFIDDLRLYSAALNEIAIQDLDQRGGGRAGAIPSLIDTSPEFWSRHWKGRFGWDTDESIPTISSPTWIQKIPILEGRDLKKFSIEASDGKRETVWPHLGPGYSGQGKILNLKVDAQPFNYLSIHGNLRGQVYQTGNSEKRLLLDRSRATGETSGVRLTSPVAAKNLRIERQDGVLAELNLFFIGNSPPSQKGREQPKDFNSPANHISYRLMPSSEALGLQGVSRGQIASLYNLRSRLVGRYFPRDRETWVGVPPELYKPPEKTSNVSETFRYSHVVLPPFLSHTGVAAIRFKLKPGNAKRAEETALNVAVRDPVVPSHELINLNLKLPAEGVSDFVLDIPDIVFPAGAPVWLTLASDQKDFGVAYLNSAEIEIWLTDTGKLEQGEVSRRAYLSDRLNLIRSDFQLASQSHPWITGEIERIRRPFKLVDELLSLVEDVLRVDPAEPTALAYAGWIKRNDTPPDFKQPESPATDVPRWAFQQGFLMRQFRQILDWWIKNRQIETGEFGGGLSNDTTLVSNWTGIALMDDPGDRYRDSLRSVVEACYRTELIKNGLNSQRMDPLHAYEQGINTVPAALLLDYGDPILVERLMETALHYQRLTGLNSASHRHFRSSLFSASELIEEGRAAMEDVYSQLMWHPGLCLAWYNGNPLVLGWTSEYADALLAHWNQDRYPMLARGIQFNSDEVVSRGLPNAEVVNLMWGVYRLTGNEKYLWLTNILLKSGNADRAEVACGRWLDFTNSGTYREPVLDEVRKRSIWDHNLEADETGLLARQIAFELTGDKKQVEDYQAALIRHLAQNMTLYTEAEPSTEAVWLPQRATQRARFGGIAHLRNAIFPGNGIS